MERKTVYSAYKRIMVFEGTAEECREYIFSQAETKLSDGNIIYRQWTMDGDTY